MIKDTAIPIERVRELLRLDRRTGKLFWRKGSTPRVSGKEAGYFGLKNYRRLQIDGIQTGAHRVVFALTVGRWPTDQIDHINGNPKDNRFINLRESTQQQNMCNRVVMSNNKTGTKGVCWDTKRGRWLASLTFQGECKLNKRFDDFHEAKAAYDAASAKYHGEFSINARP